MTWEQWFSNFLLILINEHINHMLFSYVFEFPNRCFNCLPKYTVLLYSHILWWLCKSPTTGSTKDCQPSCPPPWVYQCHCTQGTSPPRMLPVNSWGGGVLVEAPFPGMQESPSRQLWPTDFPSACRNFLRTTLHVEAAYPIFLSSPSSFRDVRPTRKAVNSPYLLMLPSSWFFLL